MFVPPVLSLLMMSFFAMRFESGLSSTLLVFGVSLLFLFLIPIIFFLHLLRKKRIGDQDARNRKERDMPYLAGVLFILSGFVVLLMSDASGYSKALFFSHLPNMVILFLINKSWKISAHMMGVGGAAGAMLYAWSIPLFVIAVIIAASVGWSRYVLRCHDVKQITAGFTLGFLLTFLQLYYITTYVPL